MNEFTEEYYRIFELDCLPESTSQELWDGIVMEKYSDLKPRMFKSWLPELSVSKKTLN